MKPHGLSRLRARCSPPLGVCDALWASVMLAQAQSGELRIDVRDSSGAAVEATGKIENLNTHAIQDFHTDSTGHYAAASLAAGRYRVEIKKDGFTPQILSVNLSLAAPLSCAVTLIPSAAHASVDVVGFTPLAAAIFRCPQSRRRCR